MMTQVVNFLRELNILVLDLGNLEMGFIIKLNEFDYFGAVFQFRVDWGCVSGRIFWGSILW